ncbi:hypothetical protein [Beggiatoa leptomitoformis]|uniref:Uncharacterized protein n=1 Tax=Beggiatoa leptomitoformis TaxID=288004 RepID=A0A2N9YE89_9GAMM|nr:hypothetical protein [Beggiatoa leptomitoformis]ALG68946.1 hypothetical protein AL038_16145 [Beggiatoa leptomitoformis]AUI68669.1 hypothetical protein BLE401_08105 [Beggiatoa leptomitoformis]
MNKEKQLAFARRQGCGQQCTLLNGFDYCDCVESRKFFQTLNKQLFEIESHPLSAIRQEHF